MENLHPCNLGLHLLHYIGMLSHQVDGPCNENRGGVLTPSVSMIIHLRSAGHHTFPPSMIDINASLISCTM